jgi:hypothetical protein
MRRENRKAGVNKKKYVEKNIDGYKGNAFIQL